MPDRLSRARGALLGQLAGDALGSQVESLPPVLIHDAYPRGLRLMEDGGRWDTLAGQPTDDGEMALALARTLVRLKTYNQDAALAAYVRWYESHPFDCGRTIGDSLRAGVLNARSQANGALMRISPLGIAAAGADPYLLAEWAMQDAELTHIHPMCKQANALYVLALAYLINAERPSDELFDYLLGWTERISMVPILVDAIHLSAFAPPPTYTEKSGWVLTAFHNALWQVQHARSIEEGIAGSVMMGGDTDTNAAIAGALVGARFGLENFPRQWVDCILCCRPRKGEPRVRRPRPRDYWPADVLELAADLLDAAHT